MTAGTFLLRFLPPKLSIGLLVRKELASGEPELQRVLALPGKGLFVDVGANRGIYSYVALSVGFRVMAFEPNPRLAEYIRKWSRRNFEVREELVSSHDGTASVAIPLSSRGTELDGLASADVTRIELQAENFRDLKVQAVTIDSFSLHDVEFIKVDVEGHELEVLKGAKNTLISNHPLLQVEIEERHKSGNIKSCHNFLSSLGYRCYFVRQSQLLELADFCYETDQNPADVGNREKYINNFYFVATEIQLRLLNRMIVNER
jgi:FkbM family methyltransferase